MDARLITLGAGLLLCTVGTVASQDQQPQTTPTARDGVYTKVQADAGKATYDKVCATCHALTPSEEPPASPDLGGAAFLERWNGRTLKELTTLIYTTMPSDGSAFLDESQSIELTAYLLQQNGFPVGQQALTDAIAARTTIVK